MKGLYNTVSEGILDISDQDLDTDSILIAVNEWAKSTQISGHKYTKNDIIEENGEPILLHNSNVLYVSLPCPIKLRFTERLASNGKLFIRMQNNPRAIRQGITILDSIEEFKKICERSNIWRVDQLSIEVSEKAKLSEPLYIPDLTTDVGYNKITILCNNILDVDTGMVVRSEKLEINKPRTIRMINMPQGPKAIKITQ